MCSLGKDFPHELSTILIFLLIFASPGVVQDSHLGQARPRDVGKGRGRGRGIGIGMGKCASIFTYHNKNASGQ